MLDNKLLVNIYILSLGKNYEVYVPINEKIGNIAKLFNSSMFDSIDFSRNNKIFNINTGVLYKNNDLIRDLDIKNGEKLILL